MLFRPSRILSRAPALKPTAEEHVWSEFALNESAEEFMDKWLDENVRPAHLRRSETLVAKVLAKRCIADAGKAGVKVAALEDVVVDIEEAIADELRIAAEKPAADG